MLTDRVSYRRTKDATTVVVSARVEKWKEALLVAWVLAWTVSGGFFIAELFNDPSEDQRLYLIILLSFWLYFEVRIGKAMFWRLFGMEFIRLKDGTLTLKKSMKKLGKAQDYFIDNIRDLAVIERADHSISKQFDSSFWVIGGETVKFDYMGKEIRFGRQLKNEEAKQLATFLAKEMPHRQDLPSE